MGGRDAQRLKVAVIEPVGGHGGMDYYDRSLCEGLSEAGADVALYTSATSAPCENGGAYRVSLTHRGAYGPDPAWLRGIRYFRGSIDALLSSRKNRMRIAHFHFFQVGPLEFFNLLLARLLGMRVVVTAHDVRAFAARFSLPFVARVAYRLSHRIIAQSRVSEKELVSVLGVPGRKIAVIPHGNYLRSVERLPLPAEARSSLGLPEGARVLLFFGQIKKVKGLDVLLRATPEVVRKFPDAILLIAGKVWKDDFGSYLKQMEELGIANHCVSHVRYIPNRETAKYYAAASVVVLPYRKIYQSGVLLMAMSHGKPVVVSDIAGMTEVVEDGVNGHVFPSDDARALAERLTEVLADLGRLRVVGERGREYVKEHHDWTEIGRKTVECYRSVLDV